MDSETSRKAAIETARSAAPSDFFDVYTARFVQPMERACSVCMRTDEWGIDIGPADDLCKRCYLRAEAAVRTGRSDDAQPKTGQPTGAVLVDGVLYESQEAYDAAQAAASDPTPEPESDEAESLASPSDAELQALTDAAVAEADPAPQPKGTKNKPAAAGKGA